MVDDTQTSAEIRAHLQEEHDDLCERLTLLADNSDLLEWQRDLARAWRDRLDGVLEHVETLPRIAFLAAVGRGKSSLIAAATGLRLDRQGNPKAWSVLPVGDGRTTLGETHIIFEDRDDLLLEVEPISSDDLETEIRLFARDQWAAASGKGVHPGSKMAGEELYELLREWLAPEADDGREVLGQEVKAALDATTLENAWVSRIDPERRSLPMQRTFNNDQPGYASLRTTLRNLMKGTLPNAPAPQTTKLRIPVSDSALGKYVHTIIDTQGIDDGPDAWISGRTDLHDFIGDPGVALVVCSDYKDAPDPVSVSVLKALSDDGTGGRAVRLLVVDNRSTDDDDDDDGARRRRGRDRKERLAQCNARLRKEGLEFPGGAVCAIDVRTEEKELRDTLIGMAEESIQHRIDAWKNDLQAGQEATSTLKNEEIAAKVRELDLRLWWAWDAHVVGSSSAPMDGLTAIARALTTHRSLNDFHWSQLYATTRRRGRYHKLNLALLGASTATRFASSRYGEALGRVTEVAKSLIAEGNDDAVTTHLTMRVADFEKAYNAYRNELYLGWKQILLEYFKSPQSTSMWRYCEGLWGQGSGYIQDVASRIESEAKSARLVHPKVADVESRLPRRPELFSLRTVTLQNFRCVEDRTIALAPTTTVLIGDNGLGKTCWLEAIAAAVGTFLPGVGAGSEPGLSDRDVRQVIRDLGGVPDRQHQLPMYVEVDAMVEGHALTWSRHIDTLPSEQATSEANALDLKAHKAGDEIRAGSERQLPVLAYYGTQRLWPPDIEANTERREVGNRIDGYRDCLQAASTHRHMLDWMRRFTFAELQRKEPIVQLRAIERAVTSCVEDAESFHYDVALEQLVLRMKGGQTFTFDMLSDGYRNIVAMVADIAWRASALNPALAAVGPLVEEAAAVVEAVVADHLDPPDRLAAVGRGLDAHRRPRGRAGWARKSRRVDRWKRQALPIRWAPGIRPSPARR